MREQDRSDLSAFFDDEPVNTSRVLEILSTERGRNTWQQQCLVRDALRADTAGAMRVDVVADVRRALTDEPVVFNPSAGLTNPRMGSPVTRNRQFAGLALAATVAGVAFFGLTQYGGVTNVDQLAGGADPASAVGFPPVNGIGGAVVEADVRPVTRVVSDDAEEGDEERLTTPAKP